MSINQAFFALTTLIITLAGFFKYYLDAKIDPLREQVNLLVHYMIEHQGKIERLEERTKKL